MSLGLWKNSASSFSTLPFFHVLLECLGAGIHSRWPSRNTLFVQGSYPATFFMEIIVAMIWAIWTARNDLIFRNLQQSVDSCKGTLRKELALVKLRARSKYQPFLWQMARHTCVILLNFFVSSTAAFVHALFLY